MAISVLRRDELYRALVAVGIKSGDGLLIHSALQFLGRPESGIQMYLDVIQQAVGVNGTLAVPTFTFAFARGHEFDPKKTPSEGMGIFSEFARRKPDARRTWHPMQSLAFIGAQAENLARRDTPSAFDDGSAFAQMLKLDFKLLLLGAEVQAASIVHYSEQRGHVPYRQWKEFTGNVKVGDIWEERTYRMFVRDLALDPQLNLEPVRQSLAAKGQWNSHKLNYGQIACCRLADFVVATDGLLAADSWALVFNKPESVAKN